jgi:hypothetical protein
VFKMILEDHTKTVAVAEVWELGSYVIRMLLGDVHQHETKAIGDIMSIWAEQGNLNENLNIRKVRRALRSCPWASEASAKKMLVYSATPTERDTPSLGSLETGSISERKEDARLWRHPNRARHSFAGLAGNRLPLLARTTPPYPPPPPRSGAS